MWKELFAVVCIIVSTVKQGRCDVGGANKFFLAGKKPENLGEGKIILQTDGKTEDGYYVTMYSTTQKGPIYSAFKVTPENAKNMNTTKCPKKGDWREYANEKAVYDKNDGYTPGQLDPCNKNTFSAESVTATFAYSNSVPQAQGVDWGDSFQQGYVELESCGELNSTLYFLTGVADFGFKVNAETKAVEKDASVETEEIKSEDGNAKLSVSPLVWTVACCFGTHKDFQSPPSLGFIVSNKKAEETPEITKISLGNLQELLGESVKLFPGDTESKCMTEEEQQAE